jgi:hypothetical protein
MGGESTPYTACVSEQWNPFRLTAEGRSAPGIAFLILAVYVTATLFVGLHHEPWRDEADSWLAARDAPLSTIFKWTRNAGTPALWYVLVKPIASLGFPYRSQEILHLVLAWTAAAVLLFRAPFTWVTKILLLASYYFLFEYAIVARSYVLTVLLLFLLLAWYPQREEQPIRHAAVLALLFNTNAHGAVMAMVLSILFLPRASRAAILIAVAGATAAWAQVRPASDAAFPHIVRYVHLFTPQHAIETAFFPGPWLRGTAAASLLILIVIAASLRKHPESVAFLILSIAGLSLLYAFIWYGGHRHAGLILLVAIGALWLARGVSHDGVSAGAAIVLNLTLGLSAIFGVQTAAADVRWGFSGSREMGEFIREQRLDRFPIAAHNIPQCEAVLPYVPRLRLWYPAVRRTGTYMLWNGEDAAGIRMRYAAAVEQAICDLTPAGKRWLMLLNVEMPDEISGFRLVYATKQPLFRNADERYWLYEWVSDQPDRYRSSRQSSSGSEPSTPPDTRHSPRPTTAGRS